METYKTETPELNELFGALSKAQGEMEVAAKDKRNPHLKSTYASLESLMAATRPSLAKHGLCVIQRILDNQLITRLGHQSGQWIESQVAISPDKATVQAYGAAVTYMKRYSYASMLGIVTADEVDDDGEAAMVPSDQERITPAQLAELQETLVYLGEDHKETAKTILNYYRISSLAHLPASRFEQVILKLKAKAAGNGS